MTRMSDQPRARRGKDSMTLLAQARPASLDAGPQSRATAAQFASVAPPATAATGTAAPRRSGNRLGPRLSVAGAGLAAAIAVAALIATSGTSPGTTGAAGRARPTAGPSARAILLAAAVNAAKAPSAGRYWRVEMVSAQTSAAGPNAHPYAVQQRWAPSVTWDARSPGQRSWTLPSTGYTSVPATRGARAAWQADGAPPLPATHAAQTAWWQTGAGVGYFGDYSPTLAQFQALPSQSAALAAAVRRAALAQEQMSQVPSGKEIQSWKESGLPTLGQDMFGVYMQLLKWDPITPQVRAAVFRDLATLPGVRSAGPMSDPLGRPGFGIAMASSQGQAGEEEILVVAPGTGALLADEYVATGPGGPAAKSVPSGATPGLAKCPAGSVAGVKAHACLLGVRATRVNGHLKIVGVLHDGTRLGVVALGPRLALAPAQVVSYDAVISAGWISTAPALPPLSRQFSMAADGQG
jgi:hypothetical protein